ncbi:MAG: T9SS type A sorting domain-containing protein, partial [Lentimicrobium sp.]|nr:T9SS type A sorting domain-containing protein [Lentimicrobium sp.]
NSLAFIKGSNGGLLFATEFGVFYTDNDLQQNIGNEWQLVGMDLPHAIPHGLEISYISNTLRVGTYGRGVWEIPLPCINDVEPLLITQNTTWDSYMRLDRSVKVGYMSTLTITEDARIAMPAEAKIIVEPGGKLIINGGTITSGCDYPWQGIEVWGNRAASQWSNVNGSYAQGYVVLDNATIENAVCALNLWKPGDYTQTGGVIHATGTTFRNNANSVHALLYRNFHPINGKEMEYNSWFNNCTFEITEDYLGIHTFYKHVDLNQVNGIKFKGCDFSLSPDAGGIAKFNQAIAAYSSGFKVEAICNTPVIGSCDDRSTFSGFYSAIYAGNGSGLSYTFSVNRADFTGNSIGIEVNSVKNHTILFCKFNLGPNKGDAGTCNTSGAPAFGIDMVGSNSFTIEENEFNKNEGAPQGLYVGIKCKDSNTPLDVIYRNSFNGLSYGNRAEGLNRYDIENDHNGLQFMCNTNQNNAIDFIVAQTDDVPNPMIHGSQGSLNLEAGNTFSANPLPEGNFKNEGKQYVNYYYNTNKPVYHTDIYVVPIQISTANSCPSNYGGSNPKNIVLDESQKLQRELDFATNLADYNNVKVLFDNLKDGGNTEGLKMEVTSSWPEDMWELRAKLLGDSPHLSEEVLKAAADKTDVLSESVLFEILSSNPDELRKESLIEYLENKEQPLPEYMISILKQLAGGITYKTVLMQDMAWYEGEKTKAANNLIRSCLNDTYIDWEYLRNWYDNMNTLNADYGIVASYMTEKNFSAATTMLDIIPAVRVLEGSDLEEYTAYKNLILWQIQLMQQDGDITTLDSTAINMLQETAKGSTGKASLMARAMLEYGQGHHFGKCLPEADQDLYKSGTTSSSVFDNGISVTANPNPAHTWVAFDYSIPVTITGAELLVTDIQGRLVVSFRVSGRQGQQVWDTRQVEKGVYVYTLKAGTVSKQGKLVIQ